MDKRDFLNLITDIVALVYLRAVQTGADLTETMLKVSDLLDIYARVGDLIDE